MENSVIQVCIMTSGLMTLKKSLNTRIIPTRRTSENFYLHTYPDLWQETTFQVCVPSHGK